MLNLNIAVLSFGILQSALLSFALLRKKSQHPSNTFLVLFLVLVGLQLTFKVISKAWLWDHARTVYMISYSYGYLVGPLIYLFLRSQKTGVVFKRSDWLHFLPFVIQTGFTIADEVFGLIYLDPLSWLFPWPTSQIISMIAYGYMGWKLIDRDNRAMRQFLLLVFAIEAIIIYTISYMVQNVSTHPDMRAVFMILTGLIYWMTYKMIESPRYFSVEHQGPVVKMVAMPQPRYANSGLRKEECDRILFQLKQAIEKEQIFLGHDITLDDVAKRLSVRKHHLSQAINQGFNVTFTELVNSWRLNEAQRRLSDPRYSDQKISAVAFDVGFSSVSTFTTMFRKRFNVTPSAFRSRQYNSRHGDAS